MTFTAKNWSDLLSQKETSLIEFSAAARPGRHASVSPELARSGIRAGLAGGDGGGGWEGRRGRRGLSGM